VCLTFTVRLPILPPVAHMLGTGLASACDEVALDAMVLELFHAGALAWSADASLPTHVGTYLACLRKARLMGSVAKVVSGNLRR
jgi:hypothetical protein